MENTLVRIWADLGGRIGGPMSFRLYLQPLVAGVLAVHDGMQDARTGQPVYFFALLTGPDRRGHLRQGWTSVARVFTLAVIIDVVYQVLVFRWVYPGELLVVAFTLACLPYLLIRGPANVIAAAFRRVRP